MVKEKETRPVSQDIGCFRIHNDALLTPNELLACLLRR